MVFRPCQGELEKIQRALRSFTQSCPFAEQDFLNWYYAGRVVPLPPAFNAIKYALKNPQHRDVITVESSKILHFVMAKPWQAAARHEEQDFGDLFAMWRKYRAECVATLRPNWQKRQVHPALEGL
eukprot:2034359-Amphidinium_carterae.1